MYSDRLTLVSAASLWMSQNSNGPKKFQFGPRRNVPSTISEHHSTTKPNRKIVISGLPLVEGVVAVALRVLVDVGNADQPDDDQARAARRRPATDRSRRAFPAGRGSTTAPSTGSACSPGSPAARAAPSAESTRRSGRPSRRSARSARCRPGRATPRRGPTRPSRSGPAPAAIRRSFSTAFADRVPDEEHEQEDQADDRHVVRLGDDQPEVRSRTCRDRRTVRATAEQAVADRVRRDRLALPDDDDQRRRTASRKNSRGSATALKMPFDEAHITPSCNFCKLQQVRI